MTPRLTDMRNLSACRGLFPGGCPLLPCTLLPNQFDKAVQSPPVPPARLASFIQELLQLLRLQFWPQSRSSVTNLIVKAFIQGYRVNFHSLRWNSLLEFIPFLFLRCKWQKCIAIYRIQENCWRR